MDLRSHLVAISEGDVSRANFTHLSQVRSSSSERDEEATTIASANSIILFSDKKTPPTTTATMKVSVILSTLLAGASAFVPQQQAYVRGGAVSELFARKAFMYVDSMTSHCLCQI